MTKITFRGRYKGEKKSHLKVVSKAIFMTATVKGCLNNTVIFHNACMFLHFVHRLGPTCNIISRKKMSSKSGMNDLIYKTFIDIP